VSVFNSGGSSRGDANNGSLVVKIQFGATSVILTGDAEEEAEHAMVGKFRTQLRADLLKVGHHGSKTSTSAEFLAAVSPKAAIISCGTPNSYGHPSPGTITRLEKAGIRIYRTDKLGTVLATSNGREFRVGSG
jgi:competence protein ComEC